jgi:hypothetical protein
VGDAVFGYYRLSFTIAKHQILHENMSHFYITLPSDSSVEYFPDNTVAHFTTKLPEPVHFDGDYEMGLSEIIYTNSWRSFPHEDLHIYLAKAGRSSVRDRQFTLKSRHYASEQDIFVELNKLFEDVGNDIKMVFSLNVDDHKVKMSFVIPAGGYSKIKLSDGFSNYFGFGGCQYAPGEYVSDTPFDMNAGLRLMYIYSDLVSYSTVGDIKSPLLRVVNASSTRGETSRITFSKPYFIPVSRKEIDTIEVNINNERGLPFPFEYGKSVVTLHFRRINRFIK